MDMPTEYRYYHKNDDDIGGKISLLCCSFSAFPAELSISRTIWKRRSRKLPRNMHRMNAQLHIVEVIQQT